jgi:hypothetical protein
MHLHSRLAPQTRHWVSQTLPTSWPAVEPTGGAIELPHALQRAAYRRQLQKKRFGIEIQANQSLKLMNNAIKIKAETKNPSQVIWYFFKLFKLIPISQPNQT